MMLAPTPPFAILEPTFFNPNTYAIHTKAKKTLTQWVLLDPIHSPGGGDAFCTDMKGFLYSKMQLSLIDEALFFSSAGTLGVHHG
jgi:hypothetical protein